ncbi:hypothetical protein L1049_012917 [Liquidambar formosana]|uniref:Potassium transporter n=1 Tax=Liquidambar formosana TaxID=63359 RepID=A0AAP0RJJ3_LIQFO
MHKYAGGTFALYSLICRHAKVSLLPNRQVANEALSTYKLEHPPEMKKNSRVKMLLEKHKALHTALLILVLLGTCMVIGVGVLTPAISDAVVPITCFILLCLFALQHYGTHRVGFLFAPIVLTWLLCISALGLYNIFRQNPHVYEAISPYYMFKFLRKTRRSGWMSLGGILLCITGSEAMFADLGGHFSYTAIQIAFTFLVYPALILAYMGQAAYLSKHHDTSDKISFYLSVPDIVRWPVLIIAILASVVGSLSDHQWNILYHQPEPVGHLACFPRVKVQAWESLEFLALGIVFTDLISGIPANFSRFVTNLPAFHRILVFVCVKSVPVPHVPPAERYIVGRVGPPAHRSYRCIVRYGYRDGHQDIDSFESELVDRLSDFIRYDWGRTHGRTNSCTEDDGSRSGESSSDCRLAVIGTVAFSGPPAYEIEESVHPESVSIGFPTVESMTDVIEMESIGNHPDTLQRLIEMELRSNPKQIYPFSGHGQGMYGHEL